MIFCYSYFIEKKATIIVTTIQNVSYLRLRSSLLCPPLFPPLCPSFHSSLRPPFRPTVRLRNRRLRHWATRSSVRSFVRTAHSFTCYALLTCSIALIRSLAHSLARSLAHSLTCSRAHGKEVFASISYYFNPLCGGPSHWLR